MGLGWLGRGSQWAWVSLAWLGVRGEAVGFDIHLLKPSSPRLAASTPATTSTSPNAPALTNSCIALAQCLRLARITGLRGRTHTTRSPLGLKDSYTAPTQASQHQRQPGSAL